MKTQRLRVWRRACIRELCREQEIPELQSYRKSIAASNPSLPYEDADNTLSAEGYGHSAAKPESQRHNRFSTVVARRQHSLRQGYRESETAKRPRCAGHVEPKNREESRIARLACWTEKTLSCKSHFESNTVGPSINRAHADVFKTKR